MSTPQRRQQPPAAGPTASPSPPPPYQPFNSAKSPASAQRQQNWSIAQLPGLSQQNQTQLLNCGIETTGQLLQRTQTPQQRQVLASQLQLHIQHVNKWSALANLAQIPAVGCQYCGLLLHAGISSPSQLAQMPVPKLHQQILRLHLATTQSQDRCPGFAEVVEWIEQAKRVSRK